MTFSGKVSGVSNMAKPDQHPQKICDTCRFFRGNIVRCGVVCGAGFWGGSCKSWSPVGITKEKEVKDGMGNKHLR